MSPRVPCGSLIIEAAKTVTCVTCHKGKDKPHSNILTPDIQYMIPVSINMVSNRSIFVRLLRLFLKPARNMVRYCLIRALIVEFGTHLEGTSWDSHQVLCEMIEVAHILVASDQTKFEICRKLIALFIRVDPGSNNEATLSAIVENTDAI